MSVPKNILAVLMLACASLAPAQGQHTLLPELAAPGSPTLVPKVGGSAFGEGVVADWDGNVYSNELYVSPRRTMRLEAGADTSKPWRVVGDNPNVRDLYFSNFRGGSVFFRDAESGKTKVVLSDNPRPNRFLAAS